MLKHMKSNCCKKLPYAHTLIVVGSSSVGQYCPKLHWFCGRHATGIRTAGTKGSQFGALPLIE